jgi:hypothetical protein
MVIDYVMVSKEENEYTAWFLSWLAAKLGIEESNVQDWEAVDDNVFFD